jgi:hypothetical protein
LVIWLRSQVADIRRNPQKLLHSSCTGQKYLIFINYVSNLQATDINGRGGRIRTYDAHTPSFAGVSRARLDAKGSLPWPVDEAHPDGSPSMQVDVYVR